MAPGDRCDGGPAPAENRSRAGEKAVKVAMRVTVSHGVGEPVHEICRVVLCHASEIEAIRR